MMHLGVKSSESSRNAAVAARGSADARATDGDHRSEAPSAPRRSNAAPNRAPLLVARRCRSRAARALMALASGASRRPLCPRDTVLTALGFFSPSRAPMHKRLFRDQALSAQLGGASGGRRASSCAASRAPAHSSAPDGAATVA